MIRAKGTTGNRPAALWVFIVATVCSLTGTRLAAIAMPWYVLTTTGSAALTGMVAFAELFPYVILKALSGPWIDRIGPVRVAVVADVLTLLAVACVPAAHAAGVLTFPALLALVAVVGLLRGPGDGAKATLVPVVAATTGSSLERVSGAYGAVDRLAATLGAFAGGLIVLALGAANALWLTAGACGLSAVVIAGVLRPLVHQRPTDPDEETSPAGPDDVRPSYLRELREGWAFLRGDAVLVAIVTMLAVTNMFEQAFGVTLVPVWALHTGGGPSAVGFIFGTSAICSFAGAVVAATIAERLPRRAVYIAAYLLVGLPRFGVLALGAPLPLAIPVLAVGGFAAGFINPVIGAVIVERIPARLMGRVNTLAMAIAWGLLPFGGLLGGLLIGAVGASNALWIVGALYVVVTMAPTLLPAWSRIERRPRRPPAHRAPARPPSPADVPSSGPSGPAVPSEPGDALTPPEGSGPATADGPRGSSRGRAAKRGRHRRSRLR